GAELCIIDSYKGYEGIYNFYNIGAFDGGDAVAKGLQWAKTGTDYGKPWTNPYKSIVGGGQYIAKTYINKGQNTVYFQKFNVKPTDPSTLYVHQYMTNVQAAYSEGRSTRNAYNAMGILQNTMVFYIPVYNNMPGSACQLPVSAGNPNPFLKSLTISDGSSKLSGMTPTFSLPSSGGTLGNSTYTIVVKKSVSSVKINATAISSKATVSGIGTVNLNAAGKTTTVKVTCKAQNGRTQDYTINITRQSN
ncbi:MAG: cadherin-like beta sandwich domain-containing protein, partial [Lachnospiraceae bacterium]|nr:cadherin-like beta sandwich domain-containing protein [Lachnospiraceae bacterium]